MLPSPKAAVLVTLLASFPLGLYQYTHVGPQADDQRAVGFQPPQAEQTSLPREASLGVVLPPGGLVTEAVGPTPLRSQGSSRLVTAPKGFLGVASEMLSTLRAKVDQWSGKPAKGRQGGTQAVAKRKWTNIVKSVQKIALDGKHAIKRRGSHSLDVRKKLPVEISDRIQNVRGKGFRYLA